MFYTFYFPAPACTNRVLLHKTHLIPLVLQSKSFAVFAAGYRSTGFPIQSGLKSLALCSSSPGCHAPVACSSVHIKARRGDSCSSVDPAGRGLLLYTPKQWCSVTRSEGGWTVISTVNMQLKSAKYCVTFTGATTKFSTFLYLLNSQLVLKCHRIEQKCQL